MSIKLNVYGQGQESPVASADYAQRHAMSQTILENMRADRIGHNRVASSPVNLNRPVQKGLRWADYLKGGK